MNLPMPLSLIRIIDLTINYAGPMTTMFLADMGAEVVKVESIQRIDDQRGIKWPPKGLLRYPNKEPGERPWNRNSNFNQINRNKFGITLDLTHPKGKIIFLELVKTADIVVDNFSARVMGNLGLTYEVLKGVKPDIIVMSMPGFGKTGPFKDYLGWGQQWESVSGLTAATGYADMPPIHPTISDPVAGLTGAFALLTALHYRNQTGKGQFIDLSHAEACAVMGAEIFLDYEISGKVPERMANRHQSMAPHGVYRCKGEDMWVAIAISSDEKWQAFCRVIGHPAWTKDVRFSSNASRYENQDDLNRLIEMWTNEHTNYEVMHILQATGIAVGVVLNIKTIFNDPHLQARGMFEIVTHPDAGTHSYPVSLWKMSKTPAHARMPAPCLGQHNAHFLGELLGLSLEEIEQLEKENIIGSEPLD